MAVWKTYRIADAISEIEEEKFVLPVIQRSLVWNEEKMELLFDTLLKGDSFGAIMAIEEGKDKKPPLFNFRPFTKDGNFIASRQVEELAQQQLFVIDGQQRLQTFYIGLKGSINGKILFFDLFSDYNCEFEFKFELDIQKLYQKSKENSERTIPVHCWYPAKDLLSRLKETNDEDQVADEIIEEKSIADDKQKHHIIKNVKAFYKNVITAETLGISKVVINKSLPAIANRQRIVELFRRLNDGGTKLSPFDLVASILKGFSWEMEKFLIEMLEGYNDIGLTQENLIKLIFLLQDNFDKEMASIEASDAQFAIQNKDRIKVTLVCLKKFLECAGLFEFYKEGSRSFIPLFFIAYHLFHKSLNNDRLLHFFDKYETDNQDFIFYKSWIYNSLINGVFKRGRGWIPEKTGIRKILAIMRNYKDKPFPVNELFQIYIKHPLDFRLEYSKENLDRLDSVFLYYLMYDLKRSNRVNDIDHIMPKSILEKHGYASEKINSIKNYQLLDFGTNRWIKSGQPFFEWVKNHVKNETEYIKAHLIPDDKTIWTEDKFEEFSNKRAGLILDKILRHIPSLNILKN
ncbi:MAG: DUF262 domain-containing protein [Endomicrobium sp.]|nr:DUF262 domain-containing protein [Endomicrobium sp.]